MLLQGDIYYHAEPLNFFRRHSQTVRAGMDAGALRVLERYRVIEEIMRAVEVAPTRRESVLNALVEEWIVAVLPQKHARGRRYNRAIYNIARRVDSQINARLAREFKRFAGERIQTQARRFVRT
jgi:hypothetical protein